MDSNLARKKQLKSLKNGKGLQYLLNEIYKVLENPMVVFDIYYNLIAYTDGIVTDDPLWNELVDKGNFTPETIGLFKEESWIDAVANNDGPILMTSDKLKYDRINIKVFDKSKMRIANINVVACNKPFEDGDPELIEEINRIISKELQGSEFYNNLDRAYQETLICDLLSGKPMDKQLITVRLADIERGMGKNLYLAVAKVPQDLPDRQGYFRDLFKQTQPRYKYYIYSGHIVMLISTDNPQLNVNKELKKLHNLFVQENIYAGISRRFENPFELQRHYKEALQMLKCGLNQAQEDNNKPHFFYMNEVEK